MPRKYKKKSDYWNNISRKDAIGEITKIGDLEIEDISIASDVTVRGRVGGSTTMNPLTIKERFQNLSGGILPYEGGGLGMVAMRDTVELCQKAYANVSIFRNTIDGMTEFSTLPVHVKMKNKKAQTLLEEWMKRIGQKRFQEQFFREFYRSGNVPIYKLRGKFASDHFKNLKSIFKNAKNDVTVGYTILNPAYVGIMNRGYGDKAYVKMLSQYEIEELKLGRTENAKERLAALPKDAQRQIKSGIAHSKIYTEIDKEDLIMVFYNKQDYEYMAIPMGFSVLDDIEWKLSLKDMDKKLSKAIDRVILLITMGDEKNGANPKNHEAIKKIMRSPSAGRVIIADWTTKAEFVIPDLKQMLGPEKYTIVNEDIRNGLQNILVGEEKFANQFIKTKVFLERLGKGQGVFIEEFLLPEARELLEAFGVDEEPTFEFEKINLEDKNIANKIIVRLMELNILTPDEGLRAMETGLLPNYDEVVAGQRSLKKLKDEGLFQRSNGGMGGGDKNSYDDGRPEGTGGERQETHNVGIQTGASSEGSDLFALSDMKKVIGKSDSLMRLAEAQIKKATGVKKLKKAQKDLVDSLCVSILENVEMTEWEDSLKHSLASQTLPQFTETNKKIESLSKEFDVDSYAASLMYHSTKFKSSKKQIKV